jgi:hypothetical protein
MATGTLFVGAALAGAVAAVKADMTKIKEHLR